MGVVLGFKLYLLLTKQDPRREKQVCRNLKNLFLLLIHTLYHKPYILMYITETKITIIVLPIPKNLKLILFLNNEIKGTTYETKNPNIVLNIFEGHFFYTSYGQEINPNENTITTVLYLDGILDAMDSNKDVQDENKMFLNLYIPDKIILMDNANEILT